MGASGVHQSWHTLRTPQVCLLTHTKLPPTHAHTRGSTTGVPHKVNRRSVFQQGSAPQSKRIPRGTVSPTGVPHTNDFATLYQRTSFPTRVSGLQFPYKIFLKRTLPQKTPLLRKLQTRIEPWLPRIDPTQMDAPRVCPNTPH